MNNTDNPNMLQLLCDFQDNPSIDTLRKHGCEVRATHYRFKYEDTKTNKKLCHREPNRFLKSMFELRAVHDLYVEQARVKQKDNYVSATGGRFIVEVKIPGVQDSTVSAANCSVSDPYRKKTAHKIAMQRLFHNLCATFNFSKEDVKRAKQEVKQQEVQTLELAMTGTPPA